MMSLSLMWCRHFDIQDFLSAVLGNPQRMIAEAMRQFDIQEFLTKMSSKFSVPKSQSGLCVTLSIKPHAISRTSNVREPLI
jgi:hypothetical protein